MPFVKSIAAGYVLFCVPKENQKSTRYFRGAGGTNQGLLALDNPKEVGLHTKKLALRFTLFCVAPIYSRCATAICRQQQMPFAFTTLPVKMRLEWPAGRSNRSGYHS